MRDTYERLIRMLDDAGIDYRLLDHAPEGVTEAVSALRGHAAAAAAKCIVLLVKLDRRRRRYVLAVVPGDRRVDLAAVRTLYDARYVGFCDAATAERLSQAVPGTVLPFALDEEVELIADPTVAASPELFFNAARLDRSVAMAGQDWAELARPRVLPIAE